MTRILSSLVAFFSITSLFAQSVPATPKLVVGITVDQLRGDYLEMFQHTFGEKGFKRLLKGGLVYTDVKYNFPHLDRATTISTIYTGANPSYHGIIGENRYDVNDKKEVPSFFDKNYMGNFTNDRYSPLPLRVSTIVDELIIASDGQSDVFAFAPHASQALASGGHAAGGAFWIEDQSGNWATSTFYKTKQPVVEQQNRTSESLSRKVTSTTWRPALDIVNYKAFPYTKNRQNFQHYFGSEKKNGVRLLKQSPYVNAEVCEIATKVLKSNSLGKRQNPDFLALTLYAGNFEKALDKNYSLEIQDTYYRLDQDIAKLLDAVDAAVGLQNALIFVVSTGYYNEQEVLPSGMVTSGGDFFPDRTIALLNMYLMAVYGREQWISKYYDQQLFFNKKLIEDKKINFVEFQEKAAEFIVQSAGVQDVVTSHQMLHGAYNQTVQRYRNGFYKGLSGDLYIELIPGWRVVYENDPDNNVRTRDNAVHAPLIFFGNNIKPQKINRVVDATEIAPSVTHRLRIRAPNAAKANILRELF